jgi:hypothetical protein
MMTRWISSATKWAPRLALCGAILMLLTGRNAAAGTAEARALLAILGGIIGGIAGAGPIALFTQRSSKGNALESSVRVVALLAVTLAMSALLVAFSRGRPISWQRSGALLASAWLILAEIAAPAWRRCRTPRQQQTPKVKKRQSLQPWVTAFAATSAAALLLLAAVRVPDIGMRGSKRSPLLTDSVEIVAPHPVALIGLDGASWELLDLASRLGAIPYMDHMRQEGVWGHLYAEDPFSPPSWTTIATGLPACAHGVDDFQQREYADGTRLPMAPTSLPFLLDRILDRAESGFRADSRGRGVALESTGRWLSQAILRPSLARVEPRLHADYRVVPTDACGVRAPRLWTIATEAGLRACVIRWLFSLPATGLPSRILSGWEDGWRTPVGANDDGLLEMARLMAADAQSGPAATEKIERYLQTADEEVQIGARLAHEIVGGPSRPDFYTHVFYFPDGLGHRLAAELRAASLRGDQPTSGVARMVEDLAEVDRLLAELGQLGYALVVVSDHGMEPLPDGTQAPIISQIYQLQWSQLLEDLELGSPLSPWFAADNSSAITLRRRPSAPPGAIDLAIVRLRALHLADGRPLFGSLDRIGEEALRLGQAATLNDPAELEMMVVGFGKPRRLGRYVRDRGIRGLHGRPLPNLDRDLGRFGIAMVRAAGTRRGKVEGLTTQDIAPLVLYLLGLPLEPQQRLEGLEIAFAADCLDKRPLRRRRCPTPLPLLADNSLNETDIQSMEALRALGYIN